MAAGGSQPKWNIYESVVLLDGYLETLQKDQPRQLIIKRVSTDLRQMAINCGIKIDDVYRNENGISYQMQSMDSAFKGKKIYVPASKLFIETVDLYRNDNEKYQKMLKEAKSMIAVQKSNKDAFLSWAAASLPEKETRWIEKNVLAFERFAVSSKIISGSIFDVTDVETLKEIFRKAINNKIFQIKHRKLINKISRDFLSYIRYCSSIEKNNDSKTGIISSRLAENNEAVSVDTSSIQTEKLQVVDFSNEASLKYTKPKTVIFRNSQPIDVSSWKDVYIYVIFKLYKIVPEKFEGLRTLPGFSRLDFGNASDSGAMVSPKKIDDNLFVETNLSATNIVRRIKALLSICGIDSEALKIFYQEKMNGSDSNSPTRQRNDANLFEKNFHSYLKDNARLADVTCTSYCSAIRVAERFALENGFLHSHLFCDDNDEIVSTVKELYENAEFVKYNELQHNRFSAAINKLLESIGVKPQVKRASFEDKHEGETLDDANPDISAVLKQHYEYGFKIDSLIELMRFRQFSEEMGINLDEDDLKLRNLILSSGTLIDGRVYCKSNSITEALQSAVDKAFAEGVNVIYYESLFNNESEIMEKYVITSPEMLKEYLRKNIHGWSFAKQFMLRDERRAEKVAVSEEIKRVWGKHPVENVDTISGRLPYIPLSNVWRVITGNDAFVLAGEGEYFLVERLRITEDEEEEILEFVDEKCQENGFVSITDVPLGDIEEENYELSRLAIYNAIYKKVLIGRYQLNAKILTRDESGLDAVQVLKQSIVGKDEFTVDEVLLMVRKITGTANRSYVFQALYDEMVRVDKNRFVADQYVHFSVDEIDAVLSDFIHDGFCAIRDITTFAMFPMCGQSWNHYLLESFCYKYSRKYSLHVIHFNDKNAGIIAKKDLNKTYNQMLAVALARTDIELNPDIAGKYLFDTGYMAKSKYSQLDNIVQQAMVIRNGR